MGGEQTILFCYAEGSGSNWEAICLDLDVAVQGTSMADVMAKLDEAVHSYIEYVHTLPEEDRKRLLARRVPWRIQLKMMLKTLFTWLWHRRDTKERHSYSVPCIV